MSYLYSDKSEIVSLFLKLSLFCGLGLMTWSVVQFLLGYLLFGFGLFTLPIYFTSVLIYMRRDNLYDLLNHTYTYPLFLLLNQYVQIVHKLRECDMGITKTVTNYVASMKTIFNLVESKYWELAISMIQIQFMFLIQGIVLSYISGHNKDYDFSTAKFGKNQYNRCFNSYKTEPVNNILNKGQPIITPGNSFGTLSQDEQTNMRDAILKNALKCLAEGGILTAKENLTNLKKGHLGMDGDLIDEIVKISLEVIEEEKKVGKLDLAEDSDDSDLDIKESLN